MTSPPVLRSVLKRATSSPALSAEDLSSPPTSKRSSLVSGFTQTSITSSSALPSTKTHRQSHSASTSPVYTPKVSFDTFENPAASMFSFTLRSTSQGYKRTRNTRVFLCASSPDESGTQALEWALENLVQDGDEFIVCRGVEEEVLEEDHDKIRDEARELMKNIQQKSLETEPDRKLSLILEYIPGKITETLDRLIALYRPDSVVVGTRGRKAWSVGLVGKGTMGSVSKYCLTHSPVPIIVVRPERKVKKAVEKRRADPKRGTHFD